LRTNHYARWILWTARLDWSGCSNQRHCVTTWLV